MDMYPQILSEKTTEMPLDGTDSSPHFLYNLSIKETEGEEKKWEKNLTENEMRHEKRSGGEEEQEQRSKYWKKYGAVRKGKECRSGSLASSCVAL